MQAEEVANKVVLPSSVLPTGDAACHDGSQRLCEAPRHFDILKLPNIRHLLKTTIAIPTMETPCMPYYIMAFWARGE